MTKDELLRLECLRLAVQSYGSNQHGDAVRERAGKFADFVRGTRDSEIIAAARNLAELVKEPGAVDGRPAAEQEPA